MTMTFAATLTATFTGSCLCGGVAYEVKGPLREVVACHCIQCRKTSGHHVAATAAPKSALTLTSDETLTWYRASDSAARGFCARCGGNLFWRPTEGGMISIFAGTLDDAAGLTMKRHIYAEFKGAYYEFGPEDEVFAKSDSHATPRDIII